MRPQLPVTQPHSTAGSTTIRRWRSFLVHPLATIGLALLLAFDAASRPITNERSVSGLWVPAYCMRGAESSLFERYVVRTPQGLELRSPNEDSWDEMTRLLSARPEDVLRLQFRSELVRTGLWAATREIETHAFTEDFGRGFTDQERLTARQLVIDQVLRPWWSTRWDAAALHALRTENVRKQRRLWGGHAHNAVSIAILCALVFSLQWVPKSPRWLRERRRVRALARGRCPGCGYSIARLPEPRCPECGETWVGKGTPGREPPLEDHRCEPGRHGPVPGAAHRRRR